MGQDTASHDSGLGLLGVEAAAFSSRGPDTSQTDWSMIFRAADGAGPGASDALERMARRYWPAIFAFVRSSGRDVHEAADLTQGFVCDVVLMRRLLALADPKRGRFRTFLLSALKNYLRDEHRRSVRLKRSAGGQPPLPLDHVTLATTAVDPAQSPEHAFSSQWGVTMLTQVLERVREECARDGLATHWSLFEERILRPALFGHPAAPYHDLVARHALEGRAQAANMVVTVKRRVGRALIEEVRGTLEHPRELQEELRDLLEALELP
jgi:RNA polymerase sigma-70 factor (ECF subfamily)